MTPRALFCMPFRNYKRYKLVLWWLFLNMFCLQEKQIFLKSWHLMLTSWRHKMTSWPKFYIDIDIFACRWARTTNFFLFLQFFRSRNTMTSLLFLLRHCLTSWRHVMTSQNLPNLSLLVDELERQKFLCFCSFIGREIQWHHYFFVASLLDVMTLRPDVTLYIMPISLLRWAWITNFCVCFTTTMGRKIQIYR